MSQGLSAAELAQIREDIVGLLPDTCDILTVTRTSDGAGGWSETTSAAYSGVACRLDFPNPGREVMANASLTPFKTGIVSLPYNTVVTTANKLLIDSVTYNITGVNTKQSWIGVIRCSVERVP